MNYQSQFQPENRIKLELAFEKWDRALQFGVSYKLLDTIISDMNLFADEKDREKFIHDSGYYRESNQYSCSISLQKFFDLVNEKETVFLASNPQSSESNFIDNFISIGYNRLASVGEWEYSHQILRKEQARETSFMKEDKTSEIIRLIDQDPNKSLEQLEKDLNTRGMSLSIIEKIYILMARRDRLAIDADTLTTRLRE